MVYDEAVLYVNAVNLSRFRYMTGTLWIVAYSTVVTYGLTSFDFMLYCTRTN